MKFVLASHNRTKLAEMQELLRELGVEVVLQSDVGLDLEPEENGTTFAENAAIKAMAVMQASGLPAIADDSGLCVDALGGAPGVQSARFGGEPKSDARNNARLLEALAGFPDPEQRRAYFCSVLVLVRHAEDPLPLIADGQWHGEILLAARGEGGFGYDPLFWVPELEQTAAELDAKLKNTLSHRAAAMRHLLARLQSQPL